MNKFFDIFLSIENTWILLVLLIISVIIFISIVNIIRWIIISLFSKTMKEGYKKMVKSKNTTAKKTEDELEEGFIEELDDDGEEDENEEGMIEDKTDQRIDKLELNQEKIEKAISTNQKYIRKIWNKIKVQENNFKLLYEAKE